MSARKINPFKGTNVLYRLRAKARTGVQSPGWTMAAVTAVPPSTLPPLPSKVPKLTLPTDRLLAAYEKRFPESGEEPTRVMDGRVVNRPMVFVQRQHAFMQQGHSEAEAFAMAEKALAKEEAQALEQLKDLTQASRAMGAVPALSTLQAEGASDGRWERLQFWRGELERTPYESWGPGKRASLDHWLARHLLQWEPHQTRYLGRDEFKGHMQAMRELVFADAIQKQRAAGDGGLRAAGLSEEDLLGLRQEQALGAYREWEAKLVEARPGEWADEEMGAMLRWLDENHELVLTGVGDAYPAKVDGGVDDQARRGARLEVLQYMAFPILRPELQGVPYLSRYLLRAFMAVGKREAAAGLRPLLHGPLGRRKTDFAGAEQAFNDSLPKLVVKTFVTVCLERPFAWQLLRRVLVDRVAASEEAALALAARLPELQGLGSAQEIAQRVEESYHQLTDVLTTLATDDDTSALSQDIQVAYQAINDLHRIAQELCHLPAGGEGGAGAGAGGAGAAVSLALDQLVDEVVQRHHGWVDEDLAIGEMLRAHGDAVVQRLFGEDVPEAHRKQEAARELRESEVLEAARLDFTWNARAAAQTAWERTHGLDTPDAYDRKWLAREAPTAGDAGLEVEADPENLEEYLLDARDGGFQVPGAGEPEVAALEEEEEDEEDEVALEAGETATGAEANVRDGKGLTRMQALEASMSEAERSALLAELKALNVVKEDQGPQQGGQQGQQQSRRQAGGRGDGKGGYQQRPRHQQGQQGQQGQQRQQRHQRKEAATQAEGQEGGDKDQQPQRQRRWGKGGQQRRHNDGGRQQQQQSPPQGEGSKKE